MHKFEEKLLNSPVKNEIFIKEVKSYIDMMIRSKSALMYDENTFDFVNLNNKLKLNISSNQIEYELVTADEIISGKAVKHTNCTLIKNTKKSKMCFKVNRKTAVIHETVEEKTKLYDEENVVVFVKEVKIKKDYCEDKRKEQILLEPSIWENYTETTYKWRTKDNEILERSIKQYIYPENEENGIKNCDYTTIRLEKWDDKEIPCGGHYYGFDKDMFFKYMQGENNSEKIKEYVYKNYEYAIYNDVYWI